MRATMPIAQGVAPCRHAGSRRRHLSWKDKRAIPPLRALSEPPKGETESKAELFLREELEREGVSVAEAIAPDTPEEIVEALEEEVQRLEEKELRLTSELDHAYSSTFSSLTVEVATDDDESRVISRKFPDINEASFKALSVEEPAVTSALLKAAQQGDQSVWLAFQRDAHRAKLQRDRVSAERIAAEAELAVARRGGGAVAAAAAAAKAKAEALQSSLGDDGSGLSTSDARRIVLISGFESFNVGLYRKAARNLARRCPNVELVVFSDRDIESDKEAVQAALDGADVFFGSLLFDFDQVEWLREAVDKIPTKFVFESALELMSTTSVGSFEMKPAPDGKKAGPPPAVKAILAKFGSGKEEDKLVGYLSFLKIGPALLKFVPGRKAKDLRNWLTVYSYWNQGGMENVEEAFAYVAREYLGASCLLYTSPSPRDRQKSRMPSSA